MAGFFGLFSGRKAKYVDETDTGIPEPENKEAFFLSDDDAKTLGNVEFMRKPNTIKRTFPKRPGGKGGEIVQEVSSMKKKTSEDNGVAMNTNGASSSPQPTEAAKEERRQGDNSMDMFRQMARNINK
ncbi:hypothetical protein VB715_01800 [Crocosphaera sp. UHCC 0190]|uniref:hypothetical protein n=1 Tax=Crocosphaera sp. UHCC 0190 TaxID=3110246 RepID=UPI002B1F60D6|nr:hypothetical protein [Crocosphaera sp. UHCC 0190]MEA5508488.1 hypothetical protein [Crocosphaera sp. UHCC 0190]